MRALFGGIAAALLASCGGGATNQSANMAGMNAQAPDTTPPGTASSSNVTAAAPDNAVQGNAAAAADANSGWAGDYSGELDVEIRDGRRPGSYRVEISTTSGGGCMGVVSGTATASGDRMAFVGTDEDTAPGAQCRIALTRDGRDLILEEGEGCTDFHGATCSFDGSATRR